MRRRRRCRWRSQSPCRPRPPAAAETLFGSIARPGRSVYVGVWDGRGRIIIREREKLWVERWRDFNGDISITTRFFFSLSLAVSRGVGERAGVPTVRPHVEERRPELARVVFTTFFCIDNESFLRSVTSPCRVLPVVRPSLLRLPLLSTGMAHNDFQSHLFAVEMSSGRFGRHFWSPQGCSAFDPQGFESLRWGQTCLWSMSLPNLHQIVEDEQEVKTVFSVTR